MAGTSGCRTRIGSEPTSWWASRRRARGRWSRILPRPRSPARLVAERSAGSRSSRTFAATGGARSSPGAQRRARARRSSSPKSAARTSTAILTTTKDRGSVTFTPPIDGTDGPRQIRSWSRSADCRRPSFTGRRSGRRHPSSPEVPGRVKLVHRGTSVIVSWPAVGGASSYEVVVNDTTAGGRSSISPRAAGGSWSHRCSLPTG